MYRTSEYPPWWGDSKYHPQRPHRLTCFQLTRDMKDLMGEVLEHYHNLNNPEAPLDDKPTREDFVEFMLLEGGVREEVIKSTDLVHFIPSCGIVQWAVTHAIMYYSPNLKKFHDDFVAYNCTTPPPDSSRDFFHQYLTVYHATTFQSALEIIE